MSQFLVTNTEFSINADENSVNINWSNDRENIHFEHSYTDKALFFNRIVVADQGLLKACSNRQKTIKSILDMTAGWGLDSFILAQHGKQVTMLEQNPLLHSILTASLSQAGKHSHTMAAAARIEAINCNSADYLKELDITDSFDCIYLDPMFPAHKSAAKPGKEMQLLQMLTDNLDIENAFELALKKALNRVVVKRPLKSAPICDRKPDLSYREKSVRFDVYLSAARKPLK